MSNVSFTISMPATTLLRNVDGKPVYLDWSTLPETVIAKIAEGGAKIILTNAFNGGGKNQPESDRLSQMQKRMDAWAKGEFVVVQRDSASGAMKEAFVDEQRARTGASVKEVEKSIADAVKAAFGDTEKATFGRFLDALSIAVSKARPNEGQQSDVRAKLEAKYARLADEAAKARAKASAKLDVTGISLD